MRSKTAIQVIGCHTEGEVGDVVIGGVMPPPGETIWEQSRWIAEDGALRDFLLHEPRGGLFRHVNLLVPPKDPRAAMGFIIMEPVHTPPMSGSNSIAVATVLLDSGIVPMEEPETRFILEAPGGLVPVLAECADGKAQRITVRNLPSFASQMDVALEVPGLGKIQVDTAYGGDSFVVVDASALGFKMQPEEARALADLGMRITRCANEQLGFDHPELPDWNHISFCLFATPLEGDRSGLLKTQHAVAIEPGKIDRSPTGTALSARMALACAKGVMQSGDRLEALSLIGSRFVGRVADRAKVGDFDAILPEISGRAWITGNYQYLLDPDDPWPRGYRLSDTWPNRP